MMSARMNELHDNGDDILKMVSELIGNGLKWIGIDWYVIWE